MPESPKTPSIKGQLITCVSFCLLASVVTLAFHSPPGFHAWQVGAKIQQQIVVVVLFAVVVGAGAAGVLLMPRFRNAAVRLVPSSLHTLELSPKKALAIALCAGIGEELLFRAALQPLLGLWLASAVFAFAHVRTAAFAPTVARKVFYLSNVFAVGVGLGLIFQYLGLLTAVLVHSIVDLAALLSLHALRSRADAHQPT